MGTRWMKYQFLWVEPNTLELYACTLFSLPKGTKNVLSSVGHDMEWIGEYF